MTAGWRALLLLNMQTLGWDGCRVGRKVRFQLIMHCCNQEGGQNCHFCYSFSYSCYPALARCLICLILTVVLCCAFGFHLYEEKSTIYTRLEAKTLLVRLKLLNWRNYRNLQNTVWLVQQDQSTAVQMMLVSFTCLVFSERSSERLHGRRPPAFSVPYCCRALLF